MTETFAEAAFGGAGEGGVAVRPPEAWVDAQPFHRPGAPRAERADGGRYFWFADCQIDWTGDQPIWFNRSVTEITTPDGLQETAQIDIDFDPGYEEVVFNHIRVIRGGEVREIDPRAGLSVFRRERDLERARYDGRLTAHLVIPDLRVGDIVDFARTTRGQHRVFGRRLGVEWTFDWGCWVGETRVRMLTAADEPLHIQAWNGAPTAKEVVLSSGLLERTWQTLDTPPVPTEPDIASWARCTKRVRVTTPVTWTEVSDTFRDFYAPEPLPDDLDAEVSVLLAETVAPAVRAVRLLRWVQERMRYQAVSIGDAGYVPRPIKTIWGSRAGDCKDASRLLTALFARAGLEASPALVNTSRGWTVQEEAPALNLFDHCIVRLRLEDRDYWLDPTNSPQGGSLDEVHQARFGWALPLIEHADLVYMGEEPVRDVWEANEEFELGATPTSPANLTITTTYRAWRADAVRRSLTSERGALVRGFIDYYSRAYGEATELTPLEVSDDLEANELKTVERYSLNQAWKKKPDNDGYEFDLVDDIFAVHLATAPTGSSRRWPIDLGLPRYLTCTTTLKLPVAINVNGWDRTYDMAGVRAKSWTDRLNFAGREVRLSRSIAVERRYLPASEAAAYFDLRSSALRTSGMTVSMATQNGRFVGLNSQKNSSPATGIGAIIWMILLGLMALSGILGALGGP